MASSQTRARRFVSSKSEIKTAAKVDCVGDERVIAGIVNATSADIQKLMMGLEAEKKASPLLRQVWDAAAENLRRARQSPSKPIDPAYNQPGVPDCLHVALIAYVMNEFYSEFNKRTRETKASGVNNYPYKNYFKLLLLAIVNVFGVPRGSATNMVVYRGLNGKMKFSNYVFFQQFLSTTRDANVAKGFAGEGTLFIIENIASSGFKSGQFLGIQGGPNLIHLDHVHPVANMPIESETLIWPYEAFEVTRIEKYENAPDRVYLRA